MAGGMDTRPHKEAPSSRWTDARYGDITPSSPDPSCLGVVRRTPIVPSLGRPSTAQTGLARRCTSRMDSRSMIRASKVGTKRLQTVGLEGPEDDHAGDHAACEPEAGPQQRSQHTVTCRVVRCRCLPGPSGSRATRLRRPRPSRSTGRRGRSSPSRRRPAGCRSATRRGGRS
jgi:hypothetical protein